MPTSRPSSSAKRSNRPASAAKRRPASAVAPVALQMDQWDGEPSHQADFRAPRDSSSMSAAARGSARPKSKTTAKTRAGTKPRIPLKGLPGQVPGARTVVHGPVNKAAILQGGPRVRKAGTDDPMNPTKLVVDKRPTYDDAVAAVARNFPVTVEDARADAEVADPGGFVAAEKFDGARAGFSYRTGWLGTGYYRDATLVLTERHNARVESLKQEHRQKVDSLMRSIHKLQDKTKDLRRADKENRRSKLIIDLQSTVGEQEAVIRAMIRSLTGFGFTDKQFAEIFGGKKKLRDVDALETGLRQSERAREVAEKKLKASEARYEQAKGTRDQLESEFEEQIALWKTQASSAEELNQQLGTALAEAEASHAREQQTVQAMEEMKTELETLRVNAKAWEEEKERNEALLENLTATIKDNEEKIAEQSQKARQLRAALKAQEKQILAASGGGVIQPPTVSHSRSRSERGTIVREDHERELERVRRISLTEREALLEEHASSLQRLERKWELRFESREAEVEAARQRERSAAAAELEVWKQKSGGDGVGKNAGLSGKSDRDASLRQSRSEIVASEAARSHLEAELAKEQMWREQHQASEVSQQGTDGLTDAGLSRQLAAAKLVNKETTRRLELAADDIAVAQAENASLSSNLNASSRDLMAAEEKVGILQASADKMLQEQRQLRTSYDRLLAAFSAKCAALQRTQNSNAEAHEQFRKKLTELGGAAEGGADAAVREDYEKQLAESKAIIDDLRSDIDTYEQQGKQANADQLRLLHRKDSPADPALEPSQPASASDPSIAALQPADFTLTSLDFVAGPDEAHAAPTSTSLAEELNRNAQFRAGLGDMLVE